jgi:hypothetical protein
MSDQERMMGLLARACYYPRSLVANGRFSVVRNARGILTLYAFVRRTEDRTMAAAWDATAVAVAESSSALLGKDSSEP